VRSDERSVQAVQLRSMLNAAEAEAKAEGLSALKKTWGLGYKSLL
jgi:hypothetical protein